MNFEFIRECRLESDSSQQHFSRQFRTVAGMTPSEYVRTLR